MHVDALSFPGVDVVVDLVEPIYAHLPERFESLEDCFERKIEGYKPWPWEDGTVDEVHCSHFLEHLDQMERVHFWNELYRVLKPGAKTTIITPHWASMRAYGDPTHKWPAICEFFWYYLKKDWRMVNAPHTDSSNVPWGFCCNFDCVWGYSLDPATSLRNQEYQQFAATYYVEARQDMICTATKA